MNLKPDYPIGKYMMSQESTRLYKEVQVMEQTQNKKITDF